MDTAVARAPASRSAVFEDGLGKRYHVSGPGGAPLEVLALSDELTAISAFEFSLRERVSALAAFQHPAFPRIRGVQRLGQEATLAVVSDRVAGARLSEVLSIAEQQLLPLDVGAALHLIRQLVHAVAALHEQGHGTCHGAIAPERLIVAANGRLSVVEHMLGAALEQLHYTHERYWKDVGIPLPNPAGTPRFDERADILQVGAVALALVVGRPLYSEEFPDRIGALAERAWGLTASGGVEPLPAAVRTWLARALQLDARQSFPSAVPARAELDRIVGAGDHVAAVAAVRSFFAEFARHSPQALAAGEPPPLTPIPVPAQTKAVLPPAAVRPAAAPAEVKTAPSVPKAPVEPVRPPEQPVRPPEQTLEQRHSEVDMDASRPWWRRRWIAVAAVLGVLACAGAIAGRWYLMPPAAAEAAGTLVVETNPAGAAVLVDGEPRGFSPVTLTLTPGAHALEVLSGDERRTIPLTIAAGGLVSQFIELPKAPPATTGQLRVRTDPAGARVTVDGVVRGQSPLTIEELTPGAHTVVLTNDLGSVTQDVVVEAGATAALVVPMATPQGAPVSGWISVAAPVEVQVYENQRLLGSSRSDRIMVAVGRHELDVVSEALGYRVTRVINVSPGQVSMVKLEWPNGSIALNAQPWADVWIDGERVGETPIGNVAVPIGLHEVVFRHPELGEHVVRATVTLTAPTRLSVDLRKR
ncbi:MAG: PEGA domain-containing protein [Acidobacteria bacterium]|nr:PEGA domain-containing protein [Acidobacteriota bacterium]